MPGAKAGACGLNAGVAEFPNVIVLASSVVFANGLAVTGSADFANGFALTACCSGAKSGSSSNTSLSSTISCWFSSVSTRPSLTACGTVFPLITAVNVLRNLLASTMP